MSSKATMKKNTTTVATTATPIVAAPTAVPPVGQATKKRKATTGGDAIGIVGGGGDVTTTTIAGEPVIKKAKKSSKKTTKSGNKVVLSKKGVVAMRVRKLKIKKANINLTRTVYKNVRPVKNPQSAWMFINAMERDRLTRSGKKVEFGEVGKISSEKWKRMTDAEKKPFYEMERQDKIRYETEMANRTPIQIELTAYLLKQQRLRRKLLVRENKALGLPTKALSAYMCFVQDKRPVLVQQFPDTKFSEVGKMLGQSWRAASEADKLNYRKRFETDKERYNAQHVIFERNRKLAMEQKALEKERIKSLKTATVTPPITTPTSIAV